MSKNMSLVWFRSLLDRFYSITSVSAYARVEFTDYCDVYRCHVDENGYESNCYTNVSRLPFHGHIHRLIHL